MILGFQRLPLHTMYRNYPILLLKSYILLAPRLRSLECGEAAKSSKIMRFTLAEPCSHRAFYFASSDKGSIVASHF